MSNIAKVAGGFGVGSFFGGLIGFGMAGPAGAIEGAKIGGALGTQVGVYAKGEEIVDKGIEKANEAANKLGEKVEKVIDKTGESIQKVCNTASVCLEKVANVWSKMALLSYGINFGLNGTLTYAKNQIELCPESFSNFTCAHLTLTPLAMNVFVIASIFSLTVIALKLRHD